jgi:putative glutamine amidotransferase
MDGIFHAGGLPLILPLTDDEEIIVGIASRFDGFLLTGGQDVSPALYGEQIKPTCGEICELRDRMESLLLCEVLKLDKPIFGICRGLQFLNAALGGTLYQDIPTELQSNLKHAQKPPYNTPSHTVSVWGELAKLLQTTELPVNSIHHQGVKTLSPRLQACAKSPDGLIEAAQMPDKRFVWAVQWHPELALDADSSRRMFAAFVDGCENPSQSVLYPMSDSAASRNRG